MSLAQKHAHIRTVWPNWQPPSETDSWQTLARLTLAPKEQSERELNVRMLAQALPPRIRRNLIAMFRQ